MEGRTVQDMLFGGACILALSTLMLAGTAYATMSLT